MAKPKKNPTFTSPKGTFRYPALTKPDYGNEQFPKTNGEFKTQLVLSRDEAQSLIDQLQPLYKEALAMGEEKYKELKVEQRKKLGGFKANDLFSEIYDQQTEEPTGDVFFKFATSASGVNQKGEQWNRKIALFDAKGKPLNSSTAIWGGTVGKVSFEAAPYFISGTGAGGLKLYLIAAQVIDLVSGGGRNAGAYGFGEEDGFEEEETPAKAAGFTDETDGNEEEDDF